jgi:hypothetical protein
MKNFSEFKNYETENSLFLHIKNLSDKLNEKIKKIFFDFFANFEEDKNMLNKFNTILNNKNDDGIMSYLLIREELQNKINFKDDEIKKLTNKISDLNINIKSLSEENYNINNELKEIKSKLFKKEIELKVEFLQNLEKDSNLYLNKIKFFL